MLNPIPQSYDLDDCLATFYDISQTQTQDVDFIRELLRPTRFQRVLEPCCGTGRILLPVAADGHSITGFDCSKTMLARARRKVAALPGGLQARVRLTTGDVTALPWPEGPFDAVLLAGNCLYELATPDEQAAAIRLAGAALRSGGHLLLDNDHMEGDLPEAWCRIGVVERSFPTGRNPDGSQLQGTSECLWADRPARLVRWRRCVAITFPDGQQRREEWVQQKHPPSAREMHAWVEAGGLEIEQFWGDYKRSAFAPESGRAIIWAVKP